MPERAVHNLLNKIVLGSEYWKVNKWLDAPSKVFGPRHRRFFGHDRKALALVGRKFGPRAVAAALLHQKLDGDKRLQRVLRIAMLIKGAKGR